MNTRRINGVWGLVLAAMVLPAGAAQAETYDMADLEQRKAAFPESQEALARGEQVYLRRCAGCHGVEGAGDGGSAAYLDPRPRDFTVDQTLFKFRSSKSGELPTDEDLFRIVSRGVSGTAMPAWGEGTFRLTEQERWEVVHYVKTLGGEDFADPDLSPYTIEDALVPIPAAPPGSQERVDAGRAIFTDVDGGGCVKCHGEQGRGNGSEAGTQTDDWGDDILPADLTKSWRYKNGTSVQDVFRTLSTGVAGTPMPGFADTLSEDDRWNLAYFVQSLSQEPRRGTVLLVQKAEGAVSEDPLAEEWLAMEPLDVPLLGQVIYGPRHHNAAVDNVSVRALYTDTDLVFHLTWNDRTESLEHSGTEGGDPPFGSSSIPSIAGIDDTFVPAEVMWERRGGQLRDSLQLQFPTKLKDGPEKPFFFLGGVGGPVYLWRWFADRQASGDRALEERLQKGARSETTVQDDDDQALSGQAVFSDGRWMLVVRRQLKTDGAKDLQFEPGALVPFAIQVWDGGNGEEGLLCSLSSWTYLRLDQPTPASAYGAGVAGVVLFQLMMLGFVALARRTPGASTVSPTEPGDLAKEKSP